MTEDKATGIATSDYKEGSNRPRPTQAINHEETPLKFILRMFKEGKLEYKDGEVYSLYDNRGKGSWRDSPKNIGVKDRRGYIDYRFRFNGNWHSLSVHRIVYALFNNIEEFPKGMHINHLDGNPSNNRIENLELCTPSDNANHAVITGLKNPENNNTAKLKWDDVREIRRRYGEGETQPKLAAEYRVNQTTISDIVLHKTWKEIS